MLVHSRQYWMLQNHKLEKADRSVSRSNIYTSAPEEVFS